ncbi:MAG: hypothetical protein DRI70_06535 [Bacteroidetes bacterium]|nr:MAG: hypothetical protein DRI70_06535 [Bacteroidota bacterium]
MIKIILALLVLLYTQNSIAQEEKKDNTGTNPANFTYDTRFYFELADLSDPSGSLMTSTVEFRLPLGRDIANLSDDPEASPFYNIGKKLQFRMRAKYKSLNIDTPEIPFGNSGISGIGDFDFRVLYMAYTSKSFLFVPGLEVTIPAATNDALGFGKTVLSPIVFGVFPGLLGKGSLFAPGYQYVFDIAGPGDRADISRSQIDLYLVWLLAKGKNWLIVDPQVVFDHETNKTLMLTEVEWGTMITPLPGASVYIRPGIGIGGDKPYSWNFEAGLKFVWR